MTTTVPANEYDAYVRRNARWNFAVNMLDLTFFNLATSFIFGATVLSLYASYLTESAVLIGLVPAIQSVGYFLPQLLLAQRAERWPRKKPYIQRISVIERLPYGAIGLLILAWPDAPHWFSYLLLIAGIGLATGAGGLAGPAWKAMLGKVISVERRGLLFGLSSALGGLLGVAGAAVSRRVLDAYAFPTSFGICFLLAFGAHVMSWICLTLNREPAREATRKAIAPREYWRRLPEVLRANTNFCRYLVGRALITLGAMGTAFYVVYARHSFGVSDSFAANLTIAALISQTLFTPILGWLADRRGHKWLTELCTLIGAAGVVLVLAAPEALWLYGVYMLVNASTAGLSVAGMSITMEFCDPEELPTYTGLANTIMSAPILLSPLLGGWIVDLAGYRALFYVALAFGLAGWLVMRWVVKEPRHAT